MVPYKRDLMIKCRNTELKNGDIFIDFFRLNIKKTLLFRIEFCDNWRKIAISPLDDRIPQFVKGFMGSIALFNENRIQSIKRMARIKKTYINVTNIYGDEFDIHFSDVELDPVENKVYCKIIIGSYLDSYDHTSKFVSPLIETVLGFHRFNWYSPYSILHDVYWDLRSKFERHECEFAVLRMEFKNFNFRLLNGRKFIIDKEKIELPIDGFIDVTADTFVEYPRIIEQGNAKLIKELINSLMNFVKFSSEWYVLEKKDLTISPYTSLDKQGIYQYFEEV